MALQNEGNKAIIGKKIVTQCRQQNNKKKQLNDNYAHSSDLLKRQGWQNASLTRTELHYLLQARAQKKRKERISHAHVSISLHPSMVAPEYICIN